jgi:hypothetical protein
MQDRHTLTHTLERRQSERYVIEHRDTMTLVEGNEAKICRVGDVSASGARILVEDPPAVGQETYLQCPEGGALPVTVIRHTSDGVGVRFSDPWATAAFWYGRIKRRIRHAFDHAA